MNRRTAIKAGLVMIGGIWVPKQRGATIVIRGPRTPAAGGSPTWYESTATTDADDLGYTGTLIGAPLTAGQTGTATKARIYVNVVTQSGNIKIQVTDSSNVLKASGSLAMPAAGNNQWAEVTFGASFAATNGTTYRVWAMTDTNSVVYFKHLSGQASGTGRITYNHAYADLPVDPVAGDTAATTQYRVALYIE